MTYIFGVLVFWCGAFFGFIAAAVFIAGKRADDYPHTDFTGEP